MTQKHAAGERLTHLNKKGEARMVDIGAKDATERKATAQCKIVMRAETLRLIMEGGIAKGDVLAVARTPELWHQSALTKSFRCAITFH